MTSLRRRVVVSAIVIAAVALLGSGLLIYVLVRGELLAQADSSLMAQARTMGALVEYDAKRKRTEFTGASVVAAEGIHLRLRINTDQGQMVAQSATPPPTANDSTRKVEAWSWLADDGTRWRSVTTPAMSLVEDDEEAIPLHVEIARPMQDLDDRLQRIAWLLVGVLVVVVAGLAGALVVVLRRSLTPLDRFAADLARLDDRTLHTRVATAGVPAELVPVVDHLNQLLGRLDEAFARERTFSTAIAHELRTPVAGLRMQFEVALSRGREAEAYRHTIDQGLTITSGLQRMITALLLLGRLDRNQVSLHPVEHDLGEAVTAAGETLRPRAEARRLRVVTTVPVPFRIESDPDLLGRIIANLLENAVAHADAGSDITIALVAVGQGWRLTLANPCAGFRAEQLPQVFERFWRGDEARTDVGQHCGLGLALCREIACRLALSLTATVEQGRFTVVVQSETGFRPLAAIQNTRPQD
jgi:two-component system, OmpR family, heavy metal sensor histidine kinase CusS